MVSHPGFGWLAQECASPPEFSASTTIKSYKNINILFNYIFLQDLIISEKKKEKMKTYIAMFKSW